MPGWVSRFAIALAALPCLATAAGCGLDIQQPDLFLLTRTGEGPKLTLLVNSGGTVRCNGSQPKPLPDKLLLQARDMTGGLNQDARHHLRIPAGRGSVFRYRVRVQAGTIDFPDTAARTHPELAQLELLALRIAQDPCHDPGGSS